MQKGVQPGIRKVYLINPVPLLASALLCIIQVMFKLNSVCSQVSILYSQILFPLF